MGARERTDSARTQGDVGRGGQETSAPGEYRWQAAVWLLDPFGKPIAVNDCVTSGHDTACPVVLDRQPEDVMVNDCVSDVV
jgi:hypothetical protein